MSNKKNPAKLYRDALALEKKGNINQAKELYQEAAELGHGSACNNLGALFEEQGDFDTAVYWYTVGVKQRNRSSYANLGAIYLMGKGGAEKDYDLARELFEVGAALGSKSCYQYLCRIYTEGLGVDANMKKAFKFLFDGLECEDGT